MYLQSCCRFRSIRGYTSRLVNKSVKGLQKHQECHEQGKDSFFHFWSKMSLTLRNLLETWMYCSTLFNDQYCNFPTYKPSSCELSKKQMCLFHQRQVWVKFQFALHFLRLVIFHYYHLPAPLPPLVSNSSFLFINARPCMPAVILY